MTLGYGEDTRDYLLENEEEKQQTRPKCPILDISINGIKTSALIDTGSQISAISDELYFAQKQVFDTCPILPLTGVTVTTATGGKRTKVTKQIYVEISHDKAKEPATILVVPKLTFSCIIGIDYLHKLRTQIDLEKYAMTVNINNQTHCLKFANPPSMESQQRKICSIETNPSNDYQITDEEIIRKVQDSGCNSSEEQKIFTKLLFKHRKIFDKRPGRLNSYEHRLEVVEHESFQARSYPVPVAYRDSVDQEIERMMELGIIQKSKSPYCNPILVVIKKNGSVRLCLDARKINEILIPDHEQMETPEILFQECTGMPYITSLDLTSSFWQVPLCPESRQYTAFSYRGRCYEFTVTPFGLKTSTASLVRGLEPVLRGLKNMLNFVDDLLCMSETFKQHIEDLNELFERFDEHGLTINLEKSAFLRKEVKFLGHILTTDGIKPDPEKIQAIHDYPSPKNQKQLRGFFGLINYYSKFTNEHAGATTPLLDLIRKGTRWKWEEDEEKHFVNIKTKFCNDVVLRYPNKEKTFYIQTDASDFALGAILSQIDDDGQQGVLQFASRTLKGAEVGYFTTEKELLAIVWALQKFRSYILGSKIIVRTDHHALTFLRECKLAHARLTRWTLAIQDYDISIEYCPGKKNIVADALSRSIREENATKDYEFPIAKLATEIPQEFERILEQLAKFQCEDDAIRDIKNNLENNAKLTDYTIVNEIVYRKLNGKQRALFPKKHINTLIDACHNLYGHAGARKCYLVMRDDFYCPRLYRLTRKRISTCAVCQKNKVYTQGSFAEARSILPARPGDLISIDYYGPLPKAKYGMRHILAVIDVFSKLTRLYPVQSATTDATIRCLVNDYIPKHGKPVAILSDQGTQFTAEKWKNKLNELGIQRILTSIRHPQANPVERTNRELSRFFRTFLREKHSQWIDWLDTIETCINEMHHETTGCIPMKLHTGKAPRKPWEHLIKKPVESEKTQEDWILIARRNMNHRRGKQAKDFNSKHRFTQYAVGDYVLVKALNVSNPAKKQIAKFMSLYEGPYVIKKVIHGASYILKHVQGNRERGLFHTHDLRPYLEDTEEK